jgi:aryl-alcohol dehydrogenase-like predicted oxidoreductase
MRYRPLPGTDLSLSVVGFGCWAIGGRWWGDDVTDERSTAAIHKALELGINWFDTAPLYGHGRADLVLTRALGERRKDVVIATKVGVRWDGAGEHAESDLSAAHVREDCERSLRRLGLERIDLLQVHWPCERGTPIEETVDALERLRREGKVRHYGLCNYDAATLRAVRQRVPLASLQTPYSMLRREFEHELRGACAEDGAAGGHPGPLGVLAYEPLARGLLTGKFRSLPSFPETDQRARDDRFKGQRFLRTMGFVATLKVAAERIKVPPAALAIAWVCSRPGVTAAIAGAKGPEQVAENARAAVMADRADLWVAMDKVVNTWNG